MAVHDKNHRMSESELSARYTQASYRFANCRGWRELMEIAEEFHALDTYKDSAQLYLKCVKGASAPAYREIAEGLKDNASPTAEDYREAARIMALIQDYSDARELMRVYTVKANALTYQSAINLLSNSEATTEEWEQAIGMLRGIKGYKDTRDLLDRYEKYFSERVYKEALTLMENGYVYTEFEEAAALFEKIPSYSDAAEQASACRKRADRLRPKAKKEKPIKNPRTNGDETVTVKPSKARESEGHAGTVVKPKKQPKSKDETVNGFVEVWKALDKRRLGVVWLWIIVFIASIAASVWVGFSESDVIRPHVGTIRMVTFMTAALSAVMGAREFLRMLTASMRKKLARAAMKLAKKLAAPLVKAVSKLLTSIGIDITRRGRLSGKDERSFVHAEAETVKKKKKKLKNQLKWMEQTDNAARVRFIFIDYMIHRIRNGYFMRHSMTTLEIGREIATEEDEKELFRVYQMARYAGASANEDITDAMVGELKNVNQKRA